MTDTAYNALLHANAIIEFDPSGTILWANSNYLKLLGYELQEIKGAHHSVFLKGNEVDTFEYRDMWLKLGSGQAFSGEFCRINKQGLPIWIQGSYNPMVSDEGKILKIIKMAVDITQRKRLEENLESKNRELANVAARAKAATYSKSVFLANMSHEIRTPLNSIIGITDTLAETELDPQQFHYIDILKRANSQLMTIINDILDLSKVEAGEMELRNFPFELSNLLEEVNSLLGFRAREKALYLSFDVAKDVGNYFVGDANRLRQVLVNLLNNAIKFTHHGGIHLKITRNTTNHSGTLLFCIEDTGIGISKHNLRAVFKPFTQADSTTTRKYGGSGLGLSITKNIVQLMNGEIWLESELNVGSRFYFTIELTPTMDKNIFLTDSESLESTTIVKSEKKFKILIVDDVDDNRNLFGIYLRNTGHELYFASSGLEAVKLASEISFDVIFMDVQMPCMDGHEATRQIRVLEKQINAPKSRIYACTANAFSEDVAKSLEAGCDMHLSKPIRKDTLLKAVGTHYAAKPELHLSL